MTDDVQWNAMKYAWTRPSMIFGVIWCSVLALLAGSMTGAMMDCNSGDIDYEQLMALDEYKDMNEWEAKNLFCERAQIGWGYIVLFLAFLIYIQYKFYKTKKEYVKKHEFR